ncbi:5-methyltetrahydrofolate--homocysteine methyltransferase [Bacteroidia bacterium]|nr:5-methyltetrahydrofolate--homocysteine methyltransferase [Bacteroidia bacterium]GHV43720.1 5-methyltetrahydrofolate--homocysteine methyltransferase [Bacteroidia bacterium]
MNIKEKTYYLEISVNEVVTLINWILFFKAWRLTGVFSKEKEAEKQKLQCEANDLLQKIIQEKALKINAFAGIFSACSDNEDIVIFAQQQKFRLPVLRQQHLSEDGFCYSLSDFLKEKDDEIGLFAVSVQGAEQLAEMYQKDGDDFNAILIKTLADRLAEAAAEWLHFKVRTEIWGYAKDELFEPKRLLADKYQGIRPAVGYPSLPDQSIIFDLDKIINFSKLQVQLTENGAMFPNASVCGMYFAHPKSKYFMIGKIDETQLSDYARRRGKTVEKMRKWLATNL